MRILSSPDDIEIFMRRCLQLASLALGHVRPNPVVGAVLVHEGRIIGEGFHQVYGGPHAEVNCIATVAANDKNLIQHSTLYVSLEPCAHFGKTPPCADLIIACKIPRVVVGCRDPFEQVNGKGIEKLQQAGVEVTVGILEPECLAINRRFFTFHTRKRPYIILKWAQTSDGMIAPRVQVAGNRLRISNDFSNRLVHKWRNEEAAIMVGTQTAIKDNPSLTNRLWKGKQPLRVLLDMNLRVPVDAALLDGTVPTIIFNAAKDERDGHPAYIRLERGKEALQQICDHLYTLNIQSVLVEGGVALLQSFIDARLFDEIRVIENNSLHLGEGIEAPTFPFLEYTRHLQLGNDSVNLFAGKPLS